MQNPSFPEWELYSISFNLIANLWATETMQNPAYPLELILRVAKVSTETVRIVNELPKLEID